MTTVSVERDGNRRRLSITGHAGYGPQGQDIVCAAASMLGQAVMQYVLNLDGAGKIVQIDEFTCREGDIRLDMRVRENTLPRVDVALDVMLNGFDLLERKYPGHVRNNCNNFSRRGATERSAMLP